MKPQRTVFVRPAVAGQVVLDPITRAALPQEGAEVALSTFWRRRITDGSVIEVDPKRRPPRPPSAAIEDAKGAS